MKFEAESTSVLENEKSLSRCAAGICLTNIQAPDGKHRTDDFIVELR
jgi:hypothetical protein